MLAVARGERRGLELAGGLRIQREGPWLTIAGPVADPVAAVSLSIPFAVDFDRWHLSSGVSPPGPFVPASGVLVLDRDAVEDDLALRPADEQGPVDIGSGSKPLAEALREAGVPLRLRARWPVLWAGGRVAGIPGVRSAFWARASAQCARYLVVSME